MPDMPKEPVPGGGVDYPLWLLLAVKRALFRVTEDPQLEDARAVLKAIDDAFDARPQPTD